MLKELIEGLALGSSVEVMAEKLGFSVGYVGMLAGTDAVRAAVARQVAEGHKTRGFSTVYGEPDDH